MRSLREWSMLIAKQTDLEIIETLLRDLLEERKLFRVSRHSVEIGPERDIVAGDGDWFIGTDCPVCREMIVVGDVLRVAIDPERGATAPRHLGCCVEDLGFSVNIRYSQEDMAYIASVPELPGCMADGQNRTDAIAAIEDAIEDWIATARSMGRKIPGEEDEKP